MLLLITELLFVLAKGHSELPPITMPPLKLLKTVLLDRVSLVGQCHSWMPQAAARYTMLFCTTVPALAT